MVFDPKQHQINLAIIRLAQLLNPGERNISKLHKEICEKLGVQPILMNTGDANHLPAPYETEDSSGRFLLPRKDCPLCKNKQSVVLAPLCQNCEEAENGKYKSKWQCLNKMCEHKELSQKAFIQWLDELGIEIPIGMKAQMGIKTWTEEGLK